MTAEQRAKIRLYLESKEGRKIFQFLKEKKTSMQKKLDEKQAELLLIKEQLEKQNMMLSMDAKEDKRKEWERKGRELKYFLDDLNEEMRKAEGEAKKKILKELEVIVNRIGREGKYHLILERVTGGVVYFSGVIDITGDVIKEYDKTRK